MVTRLCVGSVDDADDSVQESMENFYSNITPLYPKPTDMNGQIQLMNMASGSPFSTRSGGFNNLPMMSPPLNSYTHDNLENIDPQLLMSWSSNSSSSGDNFSTPFALNRARYLSGSGKSTSSSASRFPSIFLNRPLNMEEDVLVMDGILVGSAQGRRSRSGRDSSGSSSSSIKSYKMDVCHSWAETGSCQFGSNCQFSHRKQDLNMGRFSNKGKPELEICFPGSPFSNSSSLLSLRGHSSSRPTMSSRAAVSDLHGSRSRSSSRTSKDDELSPFIHSYWVPQDDGIDARPPGSGIQSPPSREQVFGYMNKYLYGPRINKRLPAFTSIFSDVPSSSSPTNLLSSESEK